MQKCVAVVSGVGRDRGGGAGGMCYCGALGGLCGIVVGVGFGMGGDTTICRVGGGVWLLWVLEDGVALHGAVGCTILGSGAPCVWVTGGVY